MTQYTALLAAILATPDDDLPRKVYADWLREQGETERAEFIEVQCRIAELQRDCWCGSCGSCARLRGGGQHTNGSCGVDMERVELPDGRSRQAFLRDRESELWRHIDSHGLIEGVPADGTWCAALNAADFAALGPKVVHVRRGFMASIRCTLADWIGGECGRCRGVGYSHRDTPEDRDRCTLCQGTGRTPGIGPQVVAAHPVQVVTTDKRTATGPNDSRCFTSTTNTRAEPGLFRLFHVLPPSLPLDWKPHGGFGGLIAEFDSDHAALSALSAACIEWAKA